MTVHWGIAGPGKIATGFANGLTMVDDAELVAVGSRSIDRAREFAARYDVAGVHGSYEDLAADPAVDIVYVATPNQRHAADALLFLEAGKHVLCEKPFALNEAQGQQMIDTARERGLFLMEAMWSRFLPGYRAIVDQIAAGAIGEPRLVEADFGFRAPFDPTHRLYDPRLGGGGLLDLGVYPIQLAALVLGPPSEISAQGWIGESGVDEQVAAVLGHPGGSLAVVKAAVATNLSCTGRIAGTDGVIELPAFMHCPQSITVVKGAERHEIDASYDGDGLRFQVHEVHRCLTAGERESPTMSHAETLSILRTLDTIRDQIGLRFPDE